MISNKKLHIIIPVALLLITLFFSLFKLTESPPIWYDEGIILQPAINSVRTGKMGMQIAPGEIISSQFISTGYPVIYPISLVFKYFGIGILQARAVMVVYLILLTGALFFLGKSIFGFKNASYAVLLIVSFAPLYGNGKNVLGEVPGLFFLVLFLYFINKIEHDYTNKPNYILAGIFAGLCVVTKPLFLVLLPAIAIGLFFLRKRVQFYWGSIAIGFASFVVPFVIWIKTQFQESATLLSILHFYSNPYDVQNLSELVWNNFLKFFTEFSPAYFFGLFLLWAIAIVIRKKQSRRLSLVEVVVFVFSTLVTLAYLRTAGWYRYFFTAQIFAFFFAPSAISTIYIFLKNRIDLLKKYKVLVFVPVLLIFFLTCVHTYQILFGSWIAQYYLSNRTEVLAGYFKDIKEDKSIFLYDSPELVVFIPHSNYYQYMEFTKTFLIGESQLSKIRDAEPDSVIIKTQALEENPSLFTSYKIISTIDHYTLLKKSGI